jgi:hypothetical protein
MLSPKLCSPIYIGTPFPPFLLHVLGGLSVGPRWNNPGTRLWDELLRWQHAILSTVTFFPIELARQECHLKRQELERIRDERAEALGSLSEMRLSLQ